MNTSSQNAYQASLFAPTVAQGVITPGSAYLLNCPPRQVFKHEKQLEDAILRDDGDLQALGSLLGLSIHNVANQVRTLPGLQDQADIVIYDRFERARAVVELMLDELDRDHLYRGLFYAIMLRASQVVLVSRSFPNRSHLQVLAVREWLDAQGVKLKIHLMQLEVFDARPRGGTGYRLTPITPVDVIPERTAPILEAIQEATAEMGDESLKGLTFVENRKLESYQGLGEHDCIRLYAGESTTRISLCFRNARLRHKVLRKRVPERLVHAFTGLGLLDWSLKPDGLTFAGFDFATPRMTPEGPDASQVARIARTYVTLRAAVLSAIGEPDRAQRDAVETSAAYLDGDESRLVS